MRNEISNPLKVSTRNGYSVVAMADLSSLSALDHAENELHSIVKTKDADIVLDMKNVFRLGSRDIGFIIHLYKELSRNGRRLYIANAESKIEDLIKSSNISKIVPVLRSLDDLDQVQDTQSARIRAGIRTKGQYSVIDLGQLPHVLAAADHLNKAIRDLFLGNQKHVAVNLSRVMLFRSDIIGLLVKWSKEFRDAGGVFCAVGIDKDVLDRLSSLDLGKALLICENEDMLPL